MSVEASGAGAGSTEAAKNLPFCCGLNRAKICIDSSQTWDIQKRILMKKRGKADAMPFPNWKQLLRIKPKLSAR